MPLTPPRAPALVLALLLASHVTLALAQAPATPDCDVCTTWNADQAPFRIFGNTYYVGVKGLSSVLVTHDIDEALYLSDRIVMLDTRAGPPRAHYDVTVPRPRSRTPAAQANLKAAILAELHAAHAI